MAKKLQLSYKEIEERLKVFKNGSIRPEEVGYTLLSAFGKGDGEIKRMREGKGVIKTFTDGLLIKGEFCYCATDSIGLVDKLERLKADDNVLKAAPKIIAVSDGNCIRAFDLRQKATFELVLSRLYCDFDFFYPLAGVERIEYVEESPADIKAAEKLAKLHDEIRAYNEFTSDSDLHDLNTFIARLLFCFFAEDTGIFEENLFTNSLRKYTLPDGSDIDSFLSEAFNVMDRKKETRSQDIPSFINIFPFVNGGLFSRKIQIPKLSRRARDIIVECGELDWQNINPDIFGSMIQAVVNPDVRANQGMHYTSVPNIMKVINPLFLDDLRGEYRKIAESLDELKKSRDLGVVSAKQYYDKCKPIKNRCNQLLLRMSKMKFFDPACGSGNFLIITYKMLRLLEMDLFTIIRECDQQDLILFIDGSHIRLSQFYGIELLDFPHEIAMLSLWLAEHQMNKKMREDFGVNTNALPLKNITQIRCGNACRLDWDEVCPHDKDDEVFVFGNPPYLGARLQDESQKHDIVHVFGDIKGVGNLDYTSCWFYKGAKFVFDSCAQVAFVSTNSICQGEQVGILWHLVLKKSDIAFAYTSFKWSNNAKNNAGVTCVIICLSSKSNTRTKYIYNEDKKEVADNINAYLTKGSNVIVCSSKTPLVNNIPDAQFGNMPNDGGYLLLEKDEKDAMINSEESSSKFIKRFWGSDEFINGGEKYCLWIEDNEVEEACQIASISERVEKCRIVRNSSPREATRKLALFPYRFGEVRHKHSDKIIIPCHSSENRKYIPMGYLDKEDVVSNASIAIYDAPIWLFGILTSRIHMDWVRAVGGRLKTDYRYSAGLCYNTFPFPKISDEKKQQIEECATDVLLVREPYLTKGETLADLYDPDKMPDDLKEAHQRLDDVVESCYDGYPFASDEARLERLFKMYEKMTKNK